MLRVLEAQAPPKQNATDTIETLSGRLNSATLLEDRRSAILGLRSFAKHYPASVASGALRSLISTLTKDVDDIDTGKLVLETLLMLFSPNDDSPEASDDIPLWLADEFSQRQDNITVLLDLLEQQDFYSRLYSLQLLSAISSARPGRTQESILSAPLGTTRLVAILEDPREAIRTAGLLLLNDITQASPELQKLVAFENAFERIFALIDAEGGLFTGGIVVQDCLSLLANLLHLNAANQSLFRETGHVAKLAQLLTPPAKNSSDAGEEQPVLSPSMDKNLWGFLAVMRMFLVQKNVGTPANQTAFEKNGLLKLVLNLGFDDSINYQIRGEALHTCAELIHGNSRIQEGFAHNKVIVTKLSDGPVHPTKVVSGVSQIYIIDALLDIALHPSPPSFFDIRFAASECIHAYFFNHNPIRLHFLRRAVDGHTMGDDETSNVLNILINGPRGSSASSDPYRIWFAARLAMQLIFNDRAAKKMAMAISEGDAEKGEEVVTAIQSMTGNLIAALQGKGDDRISIGYLMLLCVWLFDDPQAVDDFLLEGSAVQSLIQVAKRAEQGRDIIQGLCVVLLGILYEFSTKDSPLSRRTLQPLLLAGLGREQYISKVSILRSTPALRDYEVLPQGLSSAAQPGAWPEVYFDEDFVNFLKDSFNRISRAVDKDPGIEVVLASQAEGVDRDLVDSLRAKINDQTEALQKAENEKIALEGKLAQEQADHKRTQQTSTAETARIKNVNEALQRNHDAEIGAKETQHKNAAASLQETHRQKTQELEVKIQKLTTESTKQIESLRAKHNTEKAKLENSIADLESDVKQSQGTIDTLKRTNDSLLADMKQRANHLEKAKSEVKQRDTQLEKAEVEAKKLRDRLDNSVADSKEHDKKLKGMQRRIEDLETSQKDLQAEVTKKEEARAAAQTELDDLLIVLGDLEEKRSKDKKTLKALGAEVSDAEDDDEEDGDDEEVD